jgi:hypothetical protein
MPELEKATGLAVALHVLVVRAHLFIIRDQPNQPVGDLDEQIDGSLKGYLARTGMEPESIKFVPLDAAPIMDTEDYLIQWEGDVGEFTPEELFLGRHRIPRVQIPRVFPDGNTLARVWFPIPDQNQIVVRNLSTTQDEDIPDEYVPIPHDLTLILAQDLVSNAFGVVTEELPEVVIDIETPTVEVAPTTDRRPRRSVQRNGRARR